MDNISVASASFILIFIVFYRTQIFPPFCYILFLFWDVHLLNNKLFQWSWVPLEKPPAVQLLKYLPTLYWTWRFITLFVRACHCSLSWTRWNHSITPYPIFLTFTLILSSHLRLGLSSGFSLSGFPSKTLYAFLFSTTRHSLIIFNIVTCWVVRVTTITACISDDWIY
jgi:hypothetical protein